MKKTTKKKKVTKVAVAKTEKMLSLAQPQKKLQRWKTIGSIDTPEEYQEAGKVYSMAAKLAKSVDEARKEETRKLDETKRLIMDRYAPLLKFYQEVQEHCRGLVLAYDEDERKRRVAQAERQARAARDRGEPESFCIALRQNALTEVAPSPHATVTQEWRAEVVNIFDLMAAVAAGKAPIDVVTPNFKVLDKLAKEHREDTEQKVPGVKGYLFRSVRRRG